jgi:two-component system sensor histidine kinase KdpD
MSAGSPQSSPPRGKLKVFFGMSPGVGKTYAMLQAAKAKLSAGLDVVAGVVETHGRAETIALLEGIPSLPKVDIRYRGGTFAEFDLDGMLRRAPQIALIDELAHSNVPGSRHPKRYQDVEELLNAGIHVYTTVNVQHLESRADNVEQLTGVAVRERVPDTVLQWADEIEIIDISPQGLRHRLSEGKVYLGDTAASAAERFFSERNLAALREMALRSTAERVNRDLIHVLKQERGIQPLPTAERVLVAVGPSPFSERLIRWTKRYADSLNASWIAAHVEPDEPQSPEAMQRLQANLDLARRLGAEVHSTSGEAVADALLRTARRELVTQIVTGRSPRTWWQRLSGGRSLTEALIAESGAIAIHVVPADTTPRTVRWEQLRGITMVAPTQWGIACGLVAALGVAAYPLRSLTGYWTVALLFLALTTVGGFKLQRGPVLLMAVLAALTWNFFFVPPQFTFYIHSAQDVLLFFVLLLVAVLMGQLTARLQRLNASERRREMRSHALYRFLDDLNARRPIEEVLDRAVRRMSEICGAEAQLTLHGEAAIAPRRNFPAEAMPADRAEQGVMDWVISNRAAAGAGTDNLPDRDALYLPVRSADQVFAVLRLQANDHQLPLAMRDLLGQLTDALARFIEREQLRIQAKEAEVLNASRQLQRTLLDTVSHELKTPLTVIIGSIEHVQATVGSGASAALLNDAGNSAARLLRNVNLLLDLARFEGGKILPAYSSVDLHDLYARLAAELANEFADFAERVQAVIHAEFIESDEGLLFQLVNQILRNALAYGGNLPVEVAFKEADDRILITVRDHGPGLPADPACLFEPFSHGSVRRSRGLGLGLSIAARITRSLNGRISAKNHPQGGACFQLSLPRHPS